MLIPGQFLVVSRLLDCTAAMNSKSGKKEQPALETKNGVGRRRLLKFGSLVTAFTGASAMSALSGSRANAAPSDKNPSTAYVPTAEKGVASGVATLDTNSKLPAAQLPDLSAKFAPVVGASRHPLTGVFYPEGFGTITYGNGVSSAQAQANAAAVQAALDAANAASGGTVFIRGVVECYKSAASSALTTYGGVYILGSGLGGDVFSGTDAKLPYRGSAVRLWSGANQDLIRTFNFSSLTGVGNPTSYSVPARFGFRDITLDGNKVGNAIGWPLRLYGKTYVMDNVIVQNGASGGVYSEYGSGGYEMEARWSNFAITDCAGDGLEWRGPHDSLFMNGVVARNDGHIGVNIVAGSYVGGEQFANVHVWGSHKYQWTIGTNNASFSNCIADGTGGVQWVGSGNEWNGGSILGTLIPGETAITLGDGSARVVQMNTMRTRIYNFKGSMLTRLMANTSNLRNRFALSANMGGANRYTAGQGKSLTTTPLSFPVIAITVSDASSFPASGSLYISDGTTHATPSYSGIVGNTLIGVTGGSGALPVGSSIVSLSAATASDCYEVADPDNIGSGGFFQTDQVSLRTFTWLSPTSFNVGSQTLRPNSSAVALRWLRNETGRVDMTWDSSGTVGRVAWSAYHDLVEQPSDPAAPAANTARFFARDSGFGKTELCVRFPSGDVQVISSEP